MENSILIFKWGKYNQNYKAMVNTIDEIYFWYSKLDTVWIGQLGSENLKIDDNVWCMTVWSDVDWVKLKAMVYCRWNCEEGKCRLNYYIKASREKMLIQICREKIWKGTETKYDYKSELLNII